MHDSRQAFRLAILAALGHAPEVIEPGKLRRFATVDRQSDTAGWYRMFDEMRGGVFGSHRQHTSVTWRAVDRATTQRAAFAPQVMAVTLERLARQHRQSTTGSHNIAREVARNLDNGNG